MQEGFLIRHSLTCFISGFFLVLSHFRLEEREGRLPSSRLSIQEHWLHSRIANSPENCEKVHKCFVGSLKSSGLFSFLSFCFYPGRGVKGILEFWYQSPRVTEPNIKGRPSGFFYQFLYLPN